MTTSGILNFVSSQAWRNWQTRTVQVRVKVTSWRFESSCLHQTSTIVLIPLVLKLLCFFILQKCLLSKRF